MYQMQILYGIQTLPGNQGMKISRILKKILHGGLDGSALQ